jgi:phage terminase small subunit
MGLKSKAKKKPGATARTKTPPAKKAAKPPAAPKAVKAPGDAFSSLPPKQQQFVLEYLANGFNGTQAARKVGYAAANADTQASRLLANPKIALAIAERVKKITVKREITAERVLDEIAKMAFLDPRKLFRDGELVPIHELGDDTAASIAGIEVSEIKDDGFVTGQLKKIKIADKTRSLEMLGRYLKLFTDKVEHSGSLGVQLITSVPRPQRKALPKEK